MNVSRLRYVFLCLGVVLLGTLAAAVPNIPLAEQPDREPRYNATQDSQLKQAERLERVGQFTEAISIYERLVLDGSGRNPHWTAYVLFRMACAQYQAGDQPGAMESAGTAATLDPSEPSYKAFHADITSEQTNEGRSATYRARRDQGSARRLTASNGVLHIFVRGRNTLPWESEEEAKLQLRIEESDRWLKARAVENGVKAPPTFEHRYLTLKDESFWRRIDVPGAECTPSYRKAWLDAVLVRFQAGSYAELFDREFNGMDLDNRGVVFHTATRDLSLSVLLPYRPQPSDMESVFMASEASDWINLYDAVTYTHEFLHLYGADDLFNKVQDPEVPEADVMGFGASRLAECVMSAVTRYAVGWTNQAPHLSQLQLEESVDRLNRKGGTHG